MNSTTIKRFIKRHVPNSVLGSISALYSRPFKSFSGGGEDCVINEIFKGKTPGFYVDVGCFHPMIASNTYNLYRKNWRGINIDADQYKIDLFNKFRRRDINICAAISDKEGEANFYFHSAQSYGSMSGLKKNEVERKAKALDRHVMSRVVKTIPLNKILQENKIRKIDLLTVDVEGAEYEVLKTINFKEVEVGVIAVEIHGDYDSIVNGELFLFISSLGYTMIAWTPPTVFFKRP